MNETETSRGKRRLRIPRPSAGVILGMLALMVALGGVANSAVPGPNGKIHACYLIDPSDPDFSYVYIVQHDFACQAGETRLTWDQEVADQEDVAAAAAKAAQLDTGEQEKTLSQVQKALRKQKTPKFKDPNALKDYQRQLKGKGKRVMGVYIDELKKSRRAQARFNKRQNGINELLIEMLQEGVDQDEVGQALFQDLVNAVTAEP